MRVRPEVSVDPVGVETEVVELLLEFGDIVTDEPVSEGLQRQDAGAQGVGRLPQCPERARGDVSVGDDAALLLEGPE